MKIAVLADIHGNGVALRAVLEDMKRHSINEVIFLGDSVSKGPEPKYVIETLKKLNPIIWIKGNTDEWYEMVNRDWQPTDKNEMRLKRYVDFAYNQLLEEDFSYLKQLCIQESIELEGYRILCVHGSPKGINKRILPTMSHEELEYNLEYVNENLILCGHSHEDFVMEYEDIHIINPGAVGIKNDISGANYGILTIENHVISYRQKRIEYNYKEALRVAEELEFPNLTEYIDNIV